MSIKSYYTRAKVFAYMMIAVAVIALVLYLFPNLLK
jgi:uncharacterized protein YoxC